MILHDLFQSLIKRVLFQGAGIVFLMGNHMAATGNLSRIGSALIRHRLRALQWESE